MPALSVAVLVTVVIPIGNVLPLGGLLTWFVTRQLSNALTEKATLLRLHCPASAVKTRLLGHVATGFCVSITVTVKLQLAVLPFGAVAVFVTVVVPMGKVLPLGGLLTRLVTLQLSVALTVKVTLLRLHRPASADSTRLPGQVMTGF